MRMLSVSRFLPLNLKAPAGKMKESVYAWRRLVLALKWRRRASFPEWKIERLLALCRRFCIDSRKEESNESIGHQLRELIAEVPGSGYDEGDPLGQGLG
jgi:hypothetical protein